MIVRTWPDTVAVVIAALADDLDVPVVPVVAADRPDTFVVVRRSGGSHNQVLDRARVTVEAWAGAAGTSTQPVETLASTVRSTLTALPSTTPPVTKVDEESVVFFPDPVSGALRVIVTVTVTAKPQREQE